MHAPILFTTAFTTWHECPNVQRFAVVANGLFVIGAVGRFGAPDLFKFFMIDRVLAIVLAVGVYYSPCFLYPSIVVSCCLQYTISGWKLGPGYSNLLGFEFLRGTNCVLVTCLAYFGLLASIGKPSAACETVTLAVVISFQASIYVNNALAKAVLGERWYSWMTQNRVQCLVVNAYLRGWGGRWVGRDVMLKVAAIVGRFRVPLCATVFFIELGFLLILSNRELATILLTLMAIFHIFVFLLTGLIELEYVVNHATLCVLFWSREPPQVFRIDLWFASLACAVISWLWVGFVWTRIVEEYQRTGQASDYGRLGDAADLLMAWWDSPYMRMYSYVVETKSGRRGYWPVPKLSPYDTALTDIHTHVMFLNAHRGLDPEVEEDQRFVRTGVWGLVRTVRERDSLYSMMDDRSRELGRLRSARPASAWEFSGSSQGPEDAIPLRDLFQSMNKYQQYWWFRLVMRWPHFPGEDLVPDASPLTDVFDHPYAFDEPVKTVTMWRIKTFYTGDQIVLVESRIVGTFILAEPQADAR